MLLEWVSRPFIRGFFPHPMVQSFPLCSCLLAMALLVINVSPREKAAAVCRIITGDANAGTGHLVHLDGWSIGVAAARHRLAWMYFFGRTLTHFPWSIGFLRIDYPCNGFRGIERPLILLSVVAPRRGRAAPAKTCRKIRNAPRKSQAQFATCLHIIRCRFSDDYSVVISPFATRKTSWYSDCTIVKRNEYLYNEREV